MWIDALRLCACGECTPPLVNALALQRAVSDAIGNKRAEPQVVADGNGHRRSRVRGR